MKCVVDILQINGVYGQNDLYEICFRITGLILDGIHGIQRKWNEKNVT